MSTLEGLRGQERRGQDDEGDEHGRGDGRRRQGLAHDGLLLGNETLKYDYK